MKANREILLNALLTGKLVSFKNESHFAEKNVKIVELQSDDVCNKSFVFETSSGERFTRFENNIRFI